jgi:hypothetical protein
MSPLSWRANGTVFLQENASTGSVRRGAHRRFGKLRRRHVPCLVGFGKGFERKVFDNRRGQMAYPHRAMQLEGCAAGVTIGVNCG